MASEPRSRALRARPRPLGSGTGGFEPTIYIEVLVDVEGRAQALVDEEYGARNRPLSPGLRPVE